MIHSKKTSELSEQAIQKKIINQLEREGYLVLKLIKCNKNGYPDLLAVKENDTMFIEVKKPGGTVSPEQINFIDQMQKRGCVAGIAHSPEEAIEIVNGRT